MRTVVFLIAAVWLCGACAEKPPEVYHGPMAVVADTAVPLDRGSADIFYLAAVNGKPIEDSAKATASANASRGFEMTPVAISRQIPAQPATLTIVGQRVYAATVLGLMNPVAVVRGEIKFTPLPEGIYRVMGELGRGSSSVWIEDEVKGVRVSDTVESADSPAAGPPVERLGR
jgi:hypothetical protein